MATTMLQVISDALRLLNVISEIDTPSAEQGAHALRRLNQMMEQWAEEGIELGYFPQSSTASNCPVPDWALRGVISKHALDLYSTYPSGSVEPDLTDDEKNGYNTILRKVLNEKLRGADMSSMPRGSASCDDGNILTG